MAKMSDDEKLLEEAKKNFEKAMGFRDRFLTAGFLFHDVGARCNNMRESFRNKSFVAVIIRTLTCLGKFHYRYTFYQS